MTCRRLAVAGSRELAFLGAAPLDTCTWGGLQAAGAIESGLTDMTRVHID